VRNIGWNTNQAEFKAYMEKFGDVKYAVLCRAQGDEDKADGEAAATHKGTGFVRFKNKPDADALLELSQKVESQLDKDRAADRVSKVGMDDKKKKRVDDITE
jgi:RNA recognition motif-containing protein